MPKLMSPDLPQGVRAPRPGDGSSLQLGEADAITPHGEELTGMLGHAAFADPAIIDAKLSDTSVSHQERSHLRIDAATEAATAGDVDRMYELLDPRREGRFINTRTADAITAPGPRAIVLAEAVKSGHDELYKEMVRNARGAVGSYDNKVDAYLAAAEAGWAEGIDRALKLLNEPVKMTIRGPLSGHVSDAKAHEADARIARITASQTTED